MTSEAQSQRLCERLAQTAWASSTVLLDDGLRRLVERLGDDKHEAKAGTWVHMPTGQRHSIQAKTPVVMLLLLVKENLPRSSSPQLWMHRGSITYRVW